MKLYNERNFEKLVLTNLVIYFQFLLKVDVDSKYLFLGNVSYSDLYKTKTVAMFS